LSKASWRHASRWLAAKWCASRERKVVTRIPKLGTGKTNHRELQRVLSVDAAA
jgi:hypothetical protein